MVALSNIFPWPSKILLTFRRHNHTEIFGCSLILLSENRIKNGCPSYFGQTVPFFEIKLFSAYPIFFRISAAVNYIC